MPLECFYQEMSKFSIIHQIICIGFKCTSITVRGSFLELLGSFVSAWKLPSSESDQANVEM